MRCQTERSYLPSFVAGNKLQIRSGEDGFQRRSQSVITIEFFHRLDAAQDLCEPTPISRKYSAFRSFKRARQLDDQWVCCFAVHLLVCRIATDNILAELHQGVLKPATGTEENALMLTGKSNCLQSSVRTSVRTPRNAPYSRRGSQRLRGRTRGYFACRHPPERELRIEVTLKQGN